jgi:hypothetical protein
LEFVRVTLDIGHVKGFVEVPCPRVSHWNKRNGIMEKGFNNGRLERRPSLVNLRRLEPPKEKRFGEKNILGRWPDEFQDEFIKEKGKGMSLRWSR